MSYVEDDNDNDDDDDRRRRLPPVPTPTGTEWKNEIRSTAAADNDDDRHCKRNIDRYNEAKISFEI